jgi:DNA polymerase-3 subunit beta
LVPTRRLASISRTIPTDDVDLTANAETLTIESGRTVYKFQCYRADDYPPFLQQEEGTRVVMSTQSLRNMIRQTQFATTDHKARFTLNGIKVVGGSSQLEFITTDGRRLSHSVDPEVEIGDGEFQCVVDVVAMREIVRILPGEVESVEIVFGESQMMVSCGDVRLLATHLDDSFPDYEQIIPKDGVISLVLPRQQLLDAIRRVAIMAQEDNKLIHIQVTPGNIILEGDQGQAGSIRDEMVTDYDGEAFTVAYNAGYLDQYLQTTEAEQISWKLQQTSAPAVSRPVGNEERYLHMIMPLTVRTQQAAAQE